MTVFFVDVGARADSVHFEEGALTIRLEDRCWAGLLGKIRTICTMYAPSAVLQCSVGTQRGQQPVLRQQYGP